MQQSNLSQITLSNISHLYRTHPLYLNFYLRQNNDLVILASFTRAFASSVHRVVVEYSHVNERSRFITPKEKLQIETLIIDTKYRDLLERSRIKQS